MSITMDEVDEEAERRGRVQVQRRQSFAPLKPSTSSLDEVIDGTYPTFGCQRFIFVTWDVSLKRNIVCGSVKNIWFVILKVPLTTSGYSAAQLAEHYANCMKLSAENKINVKNAFNLHIIDYMAEMVRKKSSGLDNLQVRGS